MLSDYPLTTETHSAEQLFIAYKNNVHVDIEDNRYSVV